MVRVASWAATPTSPPASHLSLTQRRVLVSAVTFSCMRLYLAGSWASTRARDKSTQRSMALRFSSYQASLPGQWRSASRAWESPSCPLHPPFYPSSLYSPGLGSGVWFLLCGHCQQGLESQGLQLPHTAPHLICCLPGHKLPVDGCSEKCAREPGSQESLRPGLKLDDRERMLRARSGRLPGQTLCLLLTASP